MGNDLNDSTEDVLKDGFENNFKDILADELKNCSGDGLKDDLTYRFRGRSKNRAEDDLDDWI